VLLIVIVSIVVHGIAVTPTMRWIDIRRSRSNRKPRSRSVH
jgi:NhaP-type Na+/H+ or K+/H+ antiporter